MIKIKLLAVVGLLLAQVTNAATWTQIPTGSTKQLNCIDFPSNNVGYIGGNDSLLLKSTDGGLTWNEVAYSGISFFPNGENFVNLDFVTEDIGFAVVGTHGSVFKTSDGGSTWTQFINSMSNMCYVQGMYFFDENKGIVGGSGCFSGEYFDRYDNGTWTGSSVFWSWDGNDRITNIDFYDANYGLATSLSGLVFKTMDGGVNWDTISTGLWQPELHDVTIVNDTLAYIAYGEDGIGVLHTTDGGDTWSIDNTSGTFLYPTFFAAHTSAATVTYIGGRPSFGTHGTIFSHGINDQWWWYDDVDQAIYDIDSYSDSTVFAVGDSGYVITNADPLTLGIASSPTDLQFGVYPNPTADNVMLELGDFEGDLIQIRLYDLHGKLIRNIERGFATRLDLDLQNIPNGVYLIEVSDGVRRGSQRLVKTE